MSFFGFEQSLDLERDRRAFLDGGTSSEKEKEDIAVYTWGEENYDGLGEELQERGDELNDETFGGAGQVGKDFDFSHTALPQDNPPGLSQSSAFRGAKPPTYASEQQQQRQTTATQSGVQSRSGHTLESVWDDKSPFSVLPRVNGASRVSEQLSHQQRTQPHAQSSKFSPFGQSSTDGPLSQRAAGALSLGGNMHEGVRTLEEIEAEMRIAAAAQQRQQHQPQRLVTPSQPLSQTQLQLREAQLHAQLREQELRENQLREQQLREAQLREAQLRENQLREAQLRESQLRDSQLRESQLRETQLREVQLREAQLREIQLRESQLRGQIPRQGTPLHTATPPPRMHPHSQSPRFHQQQQQIHLIQMQQQQQQQQQQRHFLELQDQRERQQQQQLLQLQEQLRLEDLERQRQLRLQQQQVHQASPASHLPGQMLHHQRHGSGGISPALSDRPNRHARRESPALDVPFGQNVPYLPQDIQLQQRLLAEMAQAEFLNSMQGTPQTDREAREEREMQEVLRAEAMRKITEAERMEEKRRRKHMKIAHMSRYNDLMTQSDKDFITRIQVSQLVTPDPYADDYYAQTYGSIIRSRMGVQSQDDRVLKFGSGGGVGLGLGQKVPGRRPSAMQRMEAQVERIVNNARMREKEKTALNNLQGALGKTAGRSYKAAPRQLLQVDAGNTSPSPSPAPAHGHISKADAIHAEGVGAAREAAKIGREALGSAAHTNELDRQEPLTHREALVILERLYDVVLDLEQLRHQQSQLEQEEELMAWDADYATHIEKLWNGLRVNAPLETSVPHPFISLLIPVKGKRLLPRVAKYLGTQQTLTLFTLLVACFSQIDVVVKSRVLDTLEESEEQAEVENQTHAFMQGVIQSILPVVAKAELRLVSGLLGLLLERTNVVVIAPTRPGLAFLTLFFSRVEVIKQNIAVATEVSELPTPEDTDQWQSVFDHLFQLLAPHLLLLFPSIRIGAASGVPSANIPHADVMDQPTWQFLAAMALHASAEQQQILVSSLREVVLENVTSVNKGWVTDEEERKTRLGNVNIFLHALGLDSSQIAV